MGYVGALAITGIEVNHTSDICYRIHTICDLTINTLCDASFILFLQEFIFHCIIYVKGYSYENHLDSQIGKMISSKLSYHCVPSKSCGLVIPFDDIEARDDGITMLRSFLEVIGDTEGGIVAAFEVSTSDAGGSVIFTPLKWDCYSNEDIVDKKLIWKTI